MTPHSAIEHFDVFKEARTSLSHVCVLALMNQFLLQRRDETLPHRGLVSS